MTLNLNESWFILDTSKKFLAVRVVKPWDRLPCEAMNVPFLAVLKAKLEL